MSRPSHACRGYALSEQRPTLRYLSSLLRNLVTLAVCGLRRYGATELGWRPVGLRNLGGAQQSSVCAIDVPGRWLGSPCE